MIQLKKYIVFNNIYSNLSNNESCNREKTIEERTLSPKSVRIGMTTDEVLLDGWGRPKDIKKQLLTEFLNNGFMKDIDIYILRMNI